MNHEQGQGEIRAWIGATLNAHEYSALSEGSKYAAVRGELTMTTEVVAAMTAYVMSHPPQ